MPKSLGLGDHFNKWISVLEKTRKGGVNVPKYEFEKEVQQYRQVEAQQNTLIGRMKKAGLSTIEQQNRMGAMLRTIKESASGIKIQEALQFQRENQAVDPANTLLDSDIDWKKVREEQAKRTKRLDITDLPDVNAPERLV